jgi:hypothetical protein
MTSDLIARLEKAEGPIAGWRNRIQEPAHD